MARNPSAPGPFPLRLAILAGLVALLFAGSAAAHRLRPAVVDVAFPGDGTFTVELVVNLEALVAGIDPGLQDTSESPRAAEYDRLRALPPEALEARFEAFAPAYLDGIGLFFDGERVQPELADVVIPPVGDLAAERLSTVRLAGTVPPGAESFGWRYASRFGESALRIGVAAEGLVRAEWLTAGKASEAFPLEPGLAAPFGAGRVFADYTVLGFTHIVPKGLDHILFVLGIFLLSLRWRPLLYQVTAFTVAHSITLALSLYGIVELPAAVVEPLIALSIVYVAVENILTPRLKPWRVYVIFAFGLLHGLGFAGVLTELGLPRGQFVPALVGFNVGVELGQLAVIALAFLAVGVWFRARPWYRPAIVIPGSALIALTGAFWTVERVLG